MLLVLGVGGLAVAAVWLREGDSVSRRVARLVAVVAITAVAAFAAARLRASRDVSENRQNSFPPADEAVLSAIRTPLRVTVYLAAEDPRLVDLERGVLAKLRRVMTNVDVTYAARGRSGLFEAAQAHYGEVWYELDGRRAMSRSTTEPIVLETIYQLGGRQPPAPVAEPAYPGYPLAARPAHATLVFFVIWPLFVALLWWWQRRPTLPRRRSQGEAAIIGGT